MNGRIVWVASLLSTACAWGMWLWAPLADPAQDAGEPPAALETGADMRVEPEPTFRRQGGVGAPLEEPTPRRDTHRGATYDAPDEAAVELLEEEADAAYDAFVDVQRQVVVSRLEQRVESGVSNPDETRRFAALFAAVEPADGDEPEVSFRCVDSVCRMVAHLHDPEVSALYERVPAAEGYVHVIHALPGMESGSLDHLEVYRIAKEDIAALVGEHTDGILAPAPELAGVLPEGAQLLEHVPALDRPARIAQRPVGIAADDRQRPTSDREIPE